MENLRIELIEKVTNRVEELLRNDLTESIENMDIHEQVSLFNEYCENNNYMDDYVFSTDMIDDDCKSMSVVEILEQFAEFWCKSSNTDYYYYDGYNNPQVWDGIESSSISEVVSFIIENEDSLYNNDIEGILYNYTNFEIIDNIEQSSTFFSDIESCIDHIIESDLQDYDLIIEGHSVSLLN